MKRAKQILCLVLVIGLLFNNINVSNAAIEETSSITEKGAIEYAQRVASHIDTVEIANLDNVMKEYGKLEACAVLDTIINKSIMQADDTMLAIINPLLLKNSITSKIDGISTKDLQTIFKCYAYALIYFDYKEAKENYMKASSIAKEGIYDYATAKQFLEYYFLGERYAQTAISYVTSMAKYYDSWKDIIGKWGVSFIKGLIPFNKTAADIQEVTSCLEDLNKFLTSTEEYKNYIEETNNQLSLYRTRCARYLHINDEDKKTPTPSTEAQIVIATPTQAYVLINGNAVAFEAYNIDGSNYFKLRDIAASLNGTAKQFEVDWNSLNNTINLTKGSSYTSVGDEFEFSGNTSSITATPTTSIVFLNGQQINVAAYNIGGYNYSKLRDIAAAIDFGVIWNNATSSIGIDTSVGYNDSEITSPITNEPGIPSLNSPKDGYSMLVGQTVTLNWTDTDASRYKLELINDSSTETVGIDRTVTSYNFSPTVAGSWRWQVRSYLNSGAVGDASRASGITVSKTEYQPPDKPSLKSPSNGSAFQSSAPTLSWSSMSSPSGGKIKYYVETYDCPNSQNSGWITSTSWTPSSTTTGLYNWHVKSIDINTGKESGYGSVWQYSIAAEYQPPDKPILISPSNSSTYQGKAPTLSWSSMSSPSGGQIKYYAETFDCPNPENSGWITKTSWTPSSTTTGLYNWHVKSIDINTGKESGYGSVWQYSIAAEYQPPDKPILISPSNGSTYQSGAPTLKWSAMSSPSGGQIKYYVETFDCPNSQNSGWIADTSWTPSTNSLGLYNWHVKSIDINTGKESGYGSVWQFSLEGNPDSIDLHLDIRVAKFGPYDAQNTYSDQTSKVRERISNDSVTISADDSFFFSAGDPGPSFSKTLIVIYRNRWNEEWQASCSEGGSITLNRDSRSGTFLLDGDNQ